MANLRDMKARVNSTLHTFEGVLAALDATSSRLHDEHHRLVQTPSTCAVHCLPLEVHPIYDTIPDLADSA